MFAVAGVLGVVGVAGPVVGSTSLGLVEGVGSEIVPNKKTKNNKKNKTKKKQPHKEYSCSPNRQINLITTQYLPYDYVAILPCSINS